MWFHDSFLSSVNLWEKKMWSLTALLIADMTLVSRPGCSVEHKFLRIPTLEKVSLWPWESKTKQDYFVIMSEHIQKQKHFPNHKNDQTSPILVN